MSNNDKLPKKITPCPIIETVIEIRFDTDLIPDAVFGVIYNSIKDDFGKPDGLPILQLPEAIRLKDPKFLFNPHYKLTKDNYTFQIGPKVISLIASVYEGWESFSERIIELLNKINSLEIIKNVSRLGLRYTNFFDFNIIDKLEFDIKLKNETLLEKIVFKTELKDDNDNFNNIIQISNNSNLIKDNRSIKGSIFDIDTFTVEQEILNNFLNDSYTILNTAHNIEKKLFFSILKKDYWKTLNPEY